MSAIASHLPLNISGLVLKDHQ